MRFLIGLALMALVGGLALTLTSPGRTLLQDMRSLAGYRLLLHRLNGHLERGNVMLAMPDGVRLATDVYLPDRASLPLPTIYIQLPYGKRRYFEARKWINLFVPRGYAVVVQDMRGRWRSEGVFVPYTPGDGVATLDWIAAQDWSDGKVGTIGCSALGEAQVMLAARQHPAHRAMIPIGAGGAIGTARGDGGFFGVFEGGIPVLAASVGWFSRFGGKTGDRMQGFAGNPGAHLDVLPIRDAVARLRPDPTDYENLLDRLGTPGAFDTLGYISDADRFATPTLLSDTWYDPGVQSTLTLADVIGKTAQVNAVVTAGTHCDSASAFRAGRLGDLAVASEGWRDLDALYVAFMDHHLRGGPAPELAPYEFYQLREDRWLQGDTWPPAPHGLTLQMSGDNLAASAPASAPRSFTVDPRDPAPSLGGSICCTGDPAQIPGPVFLTPLDGRDDVLTYSTDVLDAPMRLAGPLSARLRLSADVPDTDIVLRLADVDPEGRALLIQEGGLRLRYRNGPDAPQLLTKGEVVAAEVRIRAIGWTLPAGHRLRLYVTGSSFPRLARNMNGGGDPHLEDTPHAARITLHPGSTLRLPVLPD